MSCHVMSPWSIDPCRAVRFFNCVLRASSHTFPPFLPVLLIYPGQPCHRLIFNTFEHFTPFPYLPNVMFLPFVVFLCSFNLPPCRSCFFTFYLHTFRFTFKFAPTLTLTLIRVDGKSINMGVASPIVIGAIFCRASTLESQDPSFFPRWASIQRPLCIHAECVFCGGCARSWRPNMDPSLSSRSKPSHANVHIHVDEHLHLHCLLATLSILFKQCFFCSSSLSSLLSSLLSPLSSPSVSRPTLVMQQHESAHAGDMNPLTV